MPAFLKCIEIENFKTYRGHHVIGPLKPFTAIMGPNGSGKSNFMEAVCFVMGEKTSLLRVKRLSDLIHGAHINKPVASSASVTATFILENQNEKKFQRFAVAHSSDYRINDSSVTEGQYLQELAELGINVKAKNFLVLQGAVQSIAMKNSQERTALFEEFCGSGIFKEQYEKYRLEVEDAEKEMQFLYLKKKGVRADMNEATKEKQEAEEYSTVEKKLAQNRTKFLLFHLYHADLTINNCEEELEYKQNDVVNIEKKWKQVDKTLKEQKKEAGIAQRDLAMVEKGIREVEVEIAKKRPIFLKAKESVTHCVKKLSSALKTLEQARKAHEAHQENISELTTELRVVKNEMLMWERSRQALAGEVHLAEIQIREYEKLKMEASRRAARYLQELDSIHREQKAHQDNIDNEMRKKMEVQNIYTQKCHERDEALNRIEKLNDHINTSQMKVDELCRRRAQLQEDMRSCREHVQALQAQLEEVTTQLGDARVDYQQETRHRKKKEVIESLMHEIPGVYGRLIHLCQPIHQRYNVALTRVMGRYVDAIVVDTQHTARRCIQMLKERLLEPETFLPVDHIKAKPLKTRLRAIKNPKNVKLLYDVLRFQPAAIFPAVQFVTNNAMVCETPEDAYYVAYEYHRDLDTRYDTLALDGTFYQKKGLISGGLQDLERRARRWDQKHLYELKDKKEKLTEELREAMKNFRKESELATLDLEIHGLEARLNKNVFMCPNRGD
ncbi:unnamed protein product [Leptidea sinapis]|uniref:SMC hinge domain-containing protein n=1 Tax=Leptidea sinapis TaxID=189913 RepID=A0A5E4R365_9NEOP|nr:unnamed protein product [Leptidea sinapis]